MSLPKRLVPDNTTFITYKDTPIPISTLPDNIVEEFGVLDRMRADAANLTYQLEVMTLAIKAKSSQLTAMIAQHLAPQTPTQQ